MQEVFNRLKQAGLTLKVEKCKFARASTPYLGHIIGGGEIRPDPLKVEAVEKYAVPETKKDVRAFLGLVGYYRRFIPNFSTVAAPLTDLTRKRMPNKVVWTNQCLQAFHELKRKLLQSNILKVADPNRPFILQTDASERGLGAVLSQKDDSGEEYSVAYSSGKLLPREQNYTTIEKECLGIVWAIRVFHTYLYGQQFTIETDHQPLSWLHRMKGTNARLVRWALALQPYNFTLVHRKGTANGNADGLSRGFPEAVSENVASMVTRTLPP